MPAVVGAELPGLSQILDWDTAHLEQTATDFGDTAARWEDAFDSTHRGVLSPGGAAWQGAAADAAQERTFRDLVKVRGLANTLQEIAAIARRGADQLDYLKRQAIDAIDDARAGGFTVGEDLSVTDTGRYSGLRVGLVRQHAATIATRAAALSAADTDIALKITSVATKLRADGFTESPTDTTTHALDDRVPLAPPPDPSYPVNDVIAVATDLDGNHVVLRRGYYDSVTKQGFGWDKVFHRHGLINPNVFKDLISHSRPQKNQGGSLVYEVPIKAAHCTSGFLNLPSCEDTGESVTMKIVVNTNPSPDVPGGGQKGVISMFPLKGGSGVVESPDGATRTPPWVNNYAPIN